MLLLAVLAVALGLFFRCHHLERKVFWDDEIYSAFRIFGYSEEEVNKSAAKAVTAGDLRAILHPTLPTAGAMRTIDTLASEEPQHAPPFFLAERLWVRWVGTSVAGMRSLSVVFSMAGLAAMFVLCRELFRSRRAAIIGVALMALAPVQVLFAQELREYALWSVAILVVTTTLMRAYNRGTARAWSLHAAATAFALYVYPSSLPVVVAQFVSVLVAHRARFRPMIAPTVALGAGLALFAPWLFVILTHSAQIQKGMATIAAEHQSPLNVVRSVLAQPRFNFLELEPQGALSRAIATLCVLSILAYALVQLRRQMSGIVWGILVATMLAPLIPTAIPDLIGGGVRSCQTRYFVPLFLAIDATLAWLLAEKIDGRLESKPWSAVLGLVLAARIVSCLAFSGVDTWWNKLGQQSIAVAAAINERPRAMLVSDSYAVWALSIAEYLRPDVRVRLQPSCYLCDRKRMKTTLEPIDYSGSIFLLGPSAELQSNYRSIAYECIDVRSNCKSDLSLWVAKRDAISEGSGHAMGTEP